MAIITITGDNNANVLTGTNATDQYHIFGLGSNDNMHGNDLADLLDGGTGDDHMGGGAGSDVYIVDSGGDSVHEENGVAGGIDRVEASATYTIADVDIENLTLTGAGHINGTGNASNNTIIGNSGNNTLLGLGGNDFMHGGDGNDTLDGGTGNDHMGGGNGNDVFVVDSAGDSVHEENGLVGGIDRINSSITLELVDADIENLTLTGAAAINGTGNAADNTINGNSGNNVLDGKAGNDHMHGNGGNDSYYVDSVGDMAHESANQGIDTVFSRASSFTLSSEVENLDLLDSSFSVGPGGVIVLSPAGINGTGNSMANTLTGSSVANQLNGMGGNDFMLGEGGNDRLDGGSGDDHMHGDAGEDVYIVDSVNDQVHELAGEGIADRVEASVTYSITDADVENLTLTGAGNINGTGNASANVLVGNSGSNTLNGLGGIDTMRGGAGNDTYIVDNLSDQVSENAGEGTDRILASVTETLTDVDVEDLTLTGAAATNGTGNASNNHIDGNAAANVLMGLAGNDILHANGGNDTVQGGSGSDDIHGSTGIDTLRAVDNVAFVDDLAEDRFVFDTTPNSVTNFDLIDIASFTAAGGEGVDDEIHLENFVFGALRTDGGTNVGTLGAAFYFEGAGLNGAAASSLVGVFNNTTTGELFYNPTFGTANDNVVFAVIGGGVAGGSAVLSAEEFTLV